MIDGFYKVERRQSMSFCTDIFYNPDTHEWYSLRTSDSDDYEILFHWYREHEEPVDEAMWWTYSLDSDKKRVHRDWEGGVSR